MNNENKICWTPEEVRKTFKCIVACSIRFTLILILSLLVLPTLILPLLLSIALPFVFALLSVGLILELNFIPFSSMGLSFNYISFAFVFLFSLLLFGAFIWPFLTKPIINYLMNNVLKKIWYIGDKENE